MAPNGAVLDGGFEVSTRHHLRDFHDDSKYSLSVSVRLEAGIRLGSRLATTFWDPIETVDVWSASDSGRSGDGNEGLRRFSLIC